jgi:hypothetical protein
MNIALPQPAAISFEEFMLSMVLTQHPHNYTDHLRKHSRAAAPRIVGEAEHWMRTGGAELSASAINTNAIPAENSSREGEGGIAGAVRFHHGDFRGIEQRLFSPG